MIAPAPWYYVDGKIVHGNDLSPVDLSDWRNGEFICQAVNAYERLLSDITELRRRTSGLVANYCETILNRESTAEPMPGRPMPTIQFWWECPVCRKRTLRAYMVCEHCHATKPQRGDVL